MKIINEPKIALTTEEVDKLQTLRAKNPICNIINCDGCSCNDCPFNELTDQLTHLLSQAVQIAETLPIYTEGE